jgi:hypothetical protein
LSLLGFCCAGNNHCNFGFCKPRNLLVFADVDYLRNQSALHDVSKCAFANYKIQKESLMSAIQIIILAVTLWSKYGGLVETGLAIIEDLKKLDGGALLSDVEAVFAKYGVDMGEVTSVVGNVTDNTTAFNNGLPVSQNVKNNGQITRFQ